MNKKEMIRLYIQTHQSTYQSNYKFHSCFQIKPDVYKFHYYMRDSQLQQIDIFFEIELKEKIKYHFKLQLHEYEQNSLVVHALERLLHYFGKEALLKGGDISKFIEHPDITIPLQNQDLMNIYNYLKCHYHITPKTVDKFYSIYLPYFERLLLQNKYKQATDSLNDLCYEMLYEYTWYGINTRYVDLEYYDHLYYFKKIILLCGPKLDCIYNQAPNTIQQLIIHLFKYERFIFCLLSTVNEIPYKSFVTKNILPAISLHFKDEQENLAYLYAYSLYYDDTKMLNDTISKIFKKIVDDALRINNHDMMIALGNYILKKYGYQVLINLFKKDRNSFIFKYFEIDDIPLKYHQEIRIELIKTLKYYAKLIDQPMYRLGCLEEIMNINLLLMKYFKEETFSET